MKATAIAPANIAFIKYWGKKDEKLRLPLNSSISMNLSNAITTTTVEFSQKYKLDIVDASFNDNEKTKIIAHLDRIRSVGKSSLRAKVVTKNSFPKGVGIASSASGFAALSVAGAAALGLGLTEKELTILTRLGSGSGSRSIPDGFVYWKSGESSQDSYAYSLFPSTHWDLRDIVVVDDREKNVSSSGGMARVKTSPFWRDRILTIPAKLEAVKYALRRKNLREFGIVMEEDCINMHAVAMTQNPQIFYWTDITMATIQAVMTWRSKGLPVYFTIDAGPSVHLFCEAKDEKTVVANAKQISGVKSLIVNCPSRGAHLI